MLININLEHNNNNGDIGQKNRIHPHKFTLWVGIGSIVMMFAGLTSAYIVKSGQPGWNEVQTPKIFIFSTLVLLLSSGTLQLAIHSFRQREMARFRGLLLTTLLLGIAFVVMQWIGFEWLWKNGVHWDGAGQGQFLYIIFGLHAVHVAGGIVALLIMTLKQYFGATKIYTVTPFEVMGTYWHFVDLLWIYLLVFFIWMM